MIRHFKVYSIATAHTHTHTHTHTYTRYSTHV